MEGMLVRAELEFARRLGTDVRLKPKQLEVLRLLAGRNSVFASLPTGYGKSLCYWLPAAAWNWRVWVVSPLVSLIEDQAQACAAVGISVSRLHSGSGNVDDPGAWDRQVLLMTPERLLAWREKGVLSWLEHRRRLPDLIVLDEMHCLDDWNEFRPGMGSVFEPVRRLIAGGAKLLGLSASFSRAARDVWIRECTEECTVVEAGLGRENLHLQVLPVADGRIRWLLLLTALRDLASPASALVYCASREECDQVTSWLRSAGIEASSYHAGHPASIRRARSEDFRIGRLRVVCATSAFGMGIDYPRVDRVIHFSLPYDVESYWQEAGRAGRDGLAAYSLVFWRRSEITRLRLLSPTARGRYMALWRLLLGDTCRKIQIAASLGLWEAACGRCDQCLRGNESLPDWLADCRSALRGLPWWLHANASIDAWLEENYLLASKKS